MTTVLAILTALVILVFGRILEKLFLDPIIEHWRLKGETSFALYFYAQAIMTPGASSDEALQVMSKAFRKLAGDFKRNLASVPFYSFWAKLRLLTPADDVEHVVGNLTGISNTSRKGDNRNDELEAGIRRRLKID